LPFSKKRIWDVADFLYPKYVHRRELVTILVTKITKNRRLQRIKAYRNDFKSNASTNSATRASLIAG